MFSYTTFQLYNFVLNAIAVIVCLVGSNGKYYITPVYVKYSQYNASTCTSTLVDKHVSDFNVNLATASFGVIASARFLLQYVLLKWFNGYAVKNWVIAGTPLMRYFEYAVTSSIMLCVLNSLFVPPDLYVQLLLSAVMIYVQYTGLASDALHQQGHKIASISTFVLGALPFSIILFYNYIVLWVYANRLPPQVIFFMVWLITGYISFPVIQLIKLLKPATTTTNIRFEYIFDLAGTITKVPILGLSYVGASVRLCSESETSFAAVGVLIALSATLGLSIFIAGRNFFLHDCTYPYNDLSPDNIHDLSPHATNHRNRRRRNKGRTQIPI